MVGNRTLYEEVTKVAEDYFGPAATRVMNRLVLNHLRKDPLSLTEKDIMELTKWTRLAMSVVTEDKAVIDEFSTRLRRLAHK